MQIYEDNKTLIILDAFPASQGQTLVIPKKHYKWVWDVPDIGSYYKIVGKIANAIKKALKTDFVVSLVIGEEVPHAHVWLVPRFKNDGHGNSINISNIKQIPKEEMERIAKKIKNLL